ncbi:MAG: hypothetical protein D6737_07950 [Chloroflexi bacterium]|nr:MAG: hypothetical protein D6737_07950 [Chloroflexota bacterium]
MVDFFEQDEDLTTGEFIRPPLEGRGGANNLGCWITALVSIFMATALILVGLFLPPVNLLDRILGLQYIQLDAQHTSAFTDGLTVAVAESAPGDGFGVAFESVPISDFLNGDASVADWIPAARAAAPPFLALQSNVYEIETTGTAPDNVRLDIAIPPNAGSPDLLDIYAWDDERSLWEFVPSQLNASGGITANVSVVPRHLALFQAAPQQATVLVSIDTSQVLTDDVGQVATIVAPAGVQPSLAGTLIGSLAPGFELNAGYLVMPTIRNFTDPRAIDPETVTRILNNTTTRAEHARQIAGFAGAGNFDGIIIDYRGLAAEQREQFSDFVRQLQNSMKDQGLLLGVVVPAAQQTADGWQTGAYDWRELGRHVDYLQVNLDLNPQDFAPGDDQPVEAMLRWAVGEVSREKVLLGLSARSVREADGVFTSIGFDEALSALGDVTLEANLTATGSLEPGSEIRVGLDGFNARSNFDANTMSPYIEFLGEADDTIARVWLTTGDALRFRMDRTIPFALGGVAFDDLLARGVADGVLGSIAGYQMQLPSSANRDALALRWRIENADGIVSEVMTGLTDELVTTIEAPDGNYAVNVAVVGGGAESARNGVAVALLAPTPTPTPLPTATPTPTATPIPPTPVPQVAVAASSGGGGIAVRPGAGSIAAGQFEYGGHVTSAGTGAVGAMQRAGMNWMKVQLRYSPGMDPGAAAAPIAAAHNNGMKILLGVLGSPNDLANGGQGYVAQFASFLGGVASMGADAIEVWNEPNIDREWPAGQISGAAYADMLRQAFEAIKRSNPSTMVISGAPAPTGAEAAFPGRVMNDDNFIRQLVDAGGLQWMDCLGAHYNEGIVGPSQTSGDPRDNYYTRYFPTMLNTYWNLIGGAKPICFTELGYLTPEGYGPLPNFFAWAQNVTVSQQAAWLAEAAAIASQSGRVRLMIIWNVDFTLYGSDPQGGYAIIRPGGGCPACDALAGAR